MDDLYQKLKEFGRVKLNETLSKHTTFKIGGPARYFVICDSAAKLAAILKFVNDHGLEYYVLGGGSNMLCPDEGFDGIVICAKGGILKVEGIEITAEAGVPLSQLVAIASQNSLTGLEWGIGIPGTVGGAVRGNAGAMGSDISKSVTSVEVWRDGEIITLDNQECQFNYRHSIFKESNVIILKAVFKIQKGDSKQIMGEMQKFAKQRAGRVTTGATCGCIFKNIKLSEYIGPTEDLPKRFIEYKKVPAGWLIEQAGCTSLKSGTAQVSPMHTNIIENLGGATKEDVMKIVEQIKEAVYNKFRVELEFEMEIL